MKKQFWSVLAVMVSTSLLADQPANRAAASGAAALTPAPARELSTVPLVAGPAVVAANHVNVRGQAKLNSEVITRMTNGEMVTVIEEITLKRSGPNEPSAWARIVLPEKARPWVHTSYIDPAGMTVKPKKLNLRGGPGENYSVLGILQRGDTVKEISRKGDWMQIETPATAYAFMAAQYLKQEPPAPVTPAEPPVIPTTVTEPPVVAAVTSETPVEVTTPPVETPVVTTEPPVSMPIPEEPLPPRIVQREGLVRGSTSIQAPTKFALVNEDSGKAINYLYTTSTNLDLSRYKGLHIIVTGEESLDERWQNTPVITIQRIQVLF